MCETLEFGAISHKKFAAPDRAVRAVTGAVECDPNDRFVQIVFGHDAGDVCMMMLNTDLLRCGMLLGVFGGKI